MKAFLIVMVVLAWGCGGDDQEFSEPNMEKEYITSLPPGDAVGSQASGLYQADLLITTCAGECPDLPIGSDVYYLCREGKQHNADVEFQQEDGSLGVTLELGIISTWMQGGINQNGKFEVGGFSSLLGSDVDLSTWAGGDFPQQDRIEGRAIVELNGPIGQIEISCRIYYEFLADKV